MHKIKTCKVTVWFKRKFNFQGITSKTKNLADREKHRKIGSY